MFEFQARNIGALWLLGDVCVFAGLDSVER